MTDTPLITLTLPTSDPDPEASSARFSRLLAEADRLAAELVALPAECWSVSRSASSAENFILMIHVHNEQLLAEEKREGPGS